MSSKKLRKYLAYYRKTLKEDPENIEARLRLAALFREMGRTRHAIDEYGTAAKLLASEGLPLEAIAACKAILELDASHQKTQLFLARLYAQVPEATEDSVRVAKPLESNSSSAGSPEGRVLRSSTESSTPPDPPDRGEAGGQDLRETIERESTMRAHNRADRAPKKANGAGRPEPSARKGRTKVQTPMDRKALREQSMEPDQDRQTIELGVFDMDSLGLDEESSPKWSDLEMPSEIEESDGGDVQLETNDGRAEGGDDETGDEREFRVSALPRIPLFSQLPRKVFVEVLDAMELEKIGAGTEILEPGDPASRLYVVVDGQVRVEKDRIDGQTVELARMGEGQIFGEFRLLTGKGGWARVIAQTDVELLMVRDEVMYELGRRHPELWEALWAFYYDRMLHNAMASSRLFGMLSGEERQLLMRHFDLAEITAGGVLFERGDDVDAMSLIVSGSVHVEVPMGGTTQVVDTLEEGAFVGVSPCAREMPATATVVARTDVVVYRMPGSIFRELMYNLPDVERAVRNVVRQRQARTPSLDDSSSVSDLV